MDKSAVKTSRSTHGGGVRTGERREKGWQPGPSDESETRAGELRASPQGPPAVKPEPPSGTTEQAAGPDGEYALQPGDGAQSLDGRSFPRRVMTRIFKVLGAFEIRPIP